jgi:hypothetical protein
VRPEGEAEERASSSVVRAIGTLLLVPALIGMATGVCVAGAFALVENVALGKLSLCAAIIPSGGKMGRSSRYAFSLARPMVRPGLP